MFVRPGTLRTSVPKTRFVKLINGGAAVMPVAAVSLSALGVAANAKGTYLLTVVITALATGTAQVLLHIDSGTTANRYLLQAAAATTIYQLSRNIASVGSTANGGALTAGVEMALGIAIDGVGGAIASLNGATTISVSGGPTSGLTTLRLGSGPAGAPAAGIITNLWVMPGTVLNAAALQAAVAAV